MSRPASKVRRDLPSSFERSRTVVVGAGVAAFLLGLVAVAPRGAHAGEPVRSAAARSEGDSAREASRPPDAGAAEAPGASPSLAFRPFVDKDFVRARQSGVPVVLYFEADWCEPCKEMHARTFREPAVLEAAAGMELFRFDMTSPDGYVDIMKNSFQVIGAPTVIVFAPGGREVARRFGFIPPDDFTEMLTRGRRPPASS